jgi:uncharacterized membrane protein
MNTGIITVLLLSLAVGVLSGLRALMGPLAVTWAARLGWLQIAPTGFAFLGYRFMPWLVTLLAIGELISDQLPTTPSRTVPVQFTARLLMGGFAGAAIGAASRVPLLGLFAGILGAAAGTLGGRAFRAWLASAFHRDRPAALVEDAVALGGAVLVVVALT